MTKSTEKTKGFYTNHPLPTVSGDQESFLLVSSAILAVKGWLGVLVMEHMAGMRGGGEE